MNSVFSYIFSLQTTSYWLLLIWPFSVGVILNKAQKQKELICGIQQERWTWTNAFVMVLPLILWAAYRPHVGDTSAYASRFINAPNSLGQIPSYISENTKDQGFSVLIILMKSLGITEYRTFFLIIAGFQILCLTYTFRKYSDNFWISIFLFIVSTDYLSWTFNGMRQFVAVCMTFAAFDLLVKKKYLPFIVIVAMASTIHGSAVIMLPLAFVMQGTALNKKTMITIIGVACCVPFVERFTPILETLLSDTQYGDVMGNEIWTSDDGTNLIRVLVYSVPALIALLGRRYVVCANDRVMNLCVNASVLTMAMYIVSSVTSGIYVGRLPVYTTFHGYMILPKIIDLIFEEKSALLINMLMILFYLFFFYFQMHFVWNYL